MTIRDWLYSTTTPPMPGHPDWTQAPVEAPITARAGRGEARELDRTLRLR